MQKFDLKTVLDKFCMLNIIERPGKNDNKMYTNVDGVTPVPSIIKQNGLPQGVNKPELFNLGEPDMAMFETFSDNLKAKIKSSPEWQKLERQMAAPGTPAAPAPAAGGIDDDDDIPF